MKVFMSWSGTRSKAAAELLHDWIKCVIQASRPWISTRGIGRGAVWFSEINNELKDTSVGIICLTHQNKTAPWILFEAGALAKGLTTTKVCTFLVDLHPADIQDPLAQFNHTLPSKDGMMSLAATLNAALEAPLDSNTLEKVFEAFWPKFEQDFTDLIAQFPQEVNVEPRSETSLLEEILEGTRGLAQRMRVIEEQRTSSNKPTIEAHTAWPFPVAPANRTIVDLASDQEAAWTALRELAAAGVTREQAFLQLKNKIGSMPARRLISQSARANPPIIFSELNPDLD